MIFHPNIRNSVIGRAFLESSIGAGIYIFSGVQPTAQQVEDNWSTIQNQLILTYSSGASWSQPNFEVPTYMLTQVPTPAQARISDVGQWCLISPNPIPESTIISSSTVPFGIYLIAPISIAGGNGVVRFNLPSLSFVQGTSYSIADGLITATA